MTLNQNEIKNENLLVNDKPTSYRASSYDLCVDTVVAAPKNPGDHGLLVSDKDFTIPPQGMVTVVSKEVVSLPQHIVGYALVKNALSNSGILAINTGIIDPGYRGPIASTLLNFSPNPYFLSSGDIFLRLTFHRINPTPEKSTTPTYNRDEYLRMTKAQVLKHSSSTFLNVAAHAKEAGNEAFSQLKKYLNVYVPVAGLVLVIVTLIVPVGITWVFGALGRIEWNAVVSADKEWQEAVESRLGALEAVRSEEAPVPAAQVDEAP